MTRFGSAVEIAAEIMTEAQELAAQLRKNGKKMGEHVREFALLARKVSTAMRNARAAVLRPEDPRPKATVLPPIPDSDAVNCERLISWAGEENIPWRRVTRQLHNSALRQALHIIPVDTLIRVRI